MSRDSIISSTQRCWCWINFAADQCPNDAVTATRAQSRTGFIYRCEEHRITDAKNFTVEEALAMEVMES